MRYCAFCGDPLHDFMKVNSEFRNALLRLEESVEKSDLPIIAGGACCHCAPKIEGANMRAPERMVFDCPRPDDTLEMLELRLASLQDDHGMATQRLSEASLAIMSELTQENIENWAEASVESSQISNRITRIERQIGVLREVRDRANGIIDRLPTPHVQCRSARIRIPSRLGRRRYAGVIRSDPRVVYEREETPNLPIQRGTLDELHATVNRVLEENLTEPQPNDLIDATRRVVWGSFPYSNVRIATVRRVNDDGTVTIETDFERMGAWSQVMRELRRTIRRVD